MLKPIALKNVLWAIEFVKIGYWAPKGQKQQSDRKKGGPKSENPLYLSNYENTRSKNWQMLRTNWYNCLKKVLWAIEFIKIGYWAPKGQKQEPSSKKVPKRVQNQKICYISAIMTLQGPKIGKC